jgi:hypothetical protein
MLDSIFILTVFFVVYAVPHSLLASSAAKEWARRTFRPGVERWYRLIYNIIAVVTLLPLFPMIALLPAETLYIVPSPWRWLMVGGQILVLIGLVASLWQTGPLHFLGLSQLVAERSTARSSLIVDGF